MFKKILIANRGEIAVRVIQACRELGVETVAVYSTADRESRHVALADDAVCIGPPPAAESYLHIPGLLTAAEIAGADAVHPGYGFLAENGDFAETLTEWGLTWIGPPAAAIRLMGDKASAREAARHAEVPVLPGSPGTLEDLQAAAEVASGVGYPVILKAVAGGGGRGMRVVKREEDLRGSFLTAREEAQAAFGDRRLYLERYVQRPRHVEFQILGDRHGEIVHLGERECSIQRRHQKLLEEAPSPVLSLDRRREMGDAAVRLAREASYSSAGTVEFLLDEDGRYYFMEMNTRIQVEHPVTEMVTGVDLVKQQIRLAAGEPLDLPSEIELVGHALECRINAEHPETFLPSPGVVERLQLPGGPGVRVDTHAYQGYRFPPHYDSLVAKVIVHGADRDEAVVRMERALGELQIDGIDTSRTLHLRILRDAEFRAGRLSTHFMERFLQIPKEVSV